MVRRVILGSVAAASLVAAVFAGQGCVVGMADLGHDCPTDDITCCRCIWPEDCIDGKKGREVPAWCDEDGGTDGGDAGEVDSGTMSLCANGVCVPHAPEAWKHVAFLMAWPNNPPACPEDSPIVEFEGSPAPPDRSCPKCLCDDPESKCILPTTWTVSSEACPGDSGVKTNFDPPSGWDGTCSSEGAIALGKLCGGVPCVRSITISPPVIEEKPCTPRMEGVADLPVLKAWHDGPAMPIGRACTSNEPLPSCLGKGCAATNSEFGACILQYGDHACPEGWNGERHVLYAKIEDSRECTACGCEAPTGGVCQVKFRTFAEAACSAENAAADIYTGMTPACHDYMPGVAIAAKSAELTDHKKGSCTPTGGELVGDLKLEEQATVCCFSSTM